MKVVNIGGGTGLSALLRGLKFHIAEPKRPARFKPAISRLTAVVTVTDEGGSSGRLRREFQIPPPGDIRNCMVALAEDEKLFTRLFNYRFKNGRNLAGHSFGNLFLAALTNLTHDFARAVRVSSEVLAIRGEIFPSTLSDVRLKASLQDGRILIGENDIHKTDVTIRRLQIVPARCRPLPETLERFRQRPAARGDNLQSADGDVGFVNVILPNQNAAVLQAGLQSHVGKRGGKNLTANGQHF